MREPRVALQVHNGIVAAVIRCPVSVCKYYDICHAKKPLLAKKPSFLGPFPSPSKHLYTLVTITTPPSPTLATFVTLVTLP